MDHSVYPVERVGNALEFLFMSDNSLGTNPVKKMINYTRLVRLGNVYYNLSPGDYDEKTRYLDDTVVTDNGDMRRVFRTVVSTLEIFFGEHPEAQVHIDGSDSRRKAYYRKLIRDHFELVSTRYDLYGSLKGNLELFKPNIEYDFITVALR